MGIRCTVKFDEVRVGKDNGSRSAAMLGGLREPRDYLSRQPRLTENYGEVRGKKPRESGVGEVRRVATTFELRRATIEQFDVPRRSWPQFINDHLIIYHSTYYYGKVSLSRGLSTVVRHSYLPFDVCTLLVG
ncbi:hypothetical protein TREMEDRAFT_64224 [Tremella mesenterica DSM 1558]|uniref:uncharacterized protein n=1 Tax=Tremella mesenterica (strain ATCC 24925 / CBS 8224 / DSM 1558 / NBRC 9311 / NRRL Y-6157 / RJB 2259-6 / UBC 559-6) TaxID=578456 RepID=UPI0003F49194|nr:uncharacterized protein TREMEDRAFT_64224 [Tremella mesenterica DSM 1558]EIW67630.1 hypothetical protein TREMEDRAFT_64224 [Tremella mesenterica DSM 1558]